MLPSFPLLNGSNSNNNSNNNNNNNSGTNTNNNKTNTNGGLMNFDLTSENKSGGSGGTSGFPTNMLKNLLENSDLNLFEILFKPLSNQSLEINEASQKNSTISNSSLLRTNSAPVNNNTQTTTQMSGTNNNESSDDGTTALFGTTTNTTHQTDNTDTDNVNSTNTNIDDDVDISSKLRDLSTFDFTDEDYLMLLKEDKLENEDFNNLKQYGNEFLGPNLWDKTDLFQSDKFGLKFECMELDDVLTENGFSNLSKLEFLEELNKNDANNNNGSNSASTSPTSPNGKSVSSPTASTSPTSTLNSTNGVISSPTASSPPVNSTTTTKNSSSLKLSEQLLWGANGDSNSSAGDFFFNKSQLKPSMSLSKLPIEKPENVKSRHNSTELNFFGITPHTSIEEIRANLKKHKKQIIPNEMKDDRYWMRRKKNNLAAKRSRDAKRIRENQITLRAAFLERENDSLKKQLDQFKKESKILKLKLMHYEQAAMQQQLLLDDKTRSLLASAQSN